jgi:hypothetical protein
MHQSSFSQTMNWIINPLQQMENGRQVLGDVFTVRVLGWANLVLIGNPELVRQAFAAAPYFAGRGKSKRSDGAGDRLGRNQLPKVVLGVKFADRIEIARREAQAAAA